MTTIENKPELANTSDKPANQIAVAIIEAAKELIECTRYPLGKGQHDPEPTRTVAPIWP